MPPTDNSTVAHLESYYRQAMSLHCSSQEAAVLTFWEHRGFQWHWTQLHGNHKNGIKWYTTANRNGVHTPTFLAQPELQNKTLFHKGWRKGYCMFLVITALFTRVSTGLSTGQMDKENVIHIHNGMLSHHSKLKFCHLQQATKEIIRLY